MWIISDFFVASVLVTDKNGGSSYCILPVFVICAAAVCNDVFATFSLSLHLTTPFSMAAAHHAPARYQVSRNAAFPAVNAAMHRVLRLNTRRARIDHISPDVFRNCQTFGGIGGTDCSGLATSRHLESHKQLVPCGVKDAISGSLVRHAVINAIFVGPRMWPAVM